jgi:predicted transcriptional regulator
MSKASTRVLELRVGPAGDALDRFEAAWNRAAEGRAPSALHVLSFVDLPLLLRTLSPARFALLSKLRRTAGSGLPASTSARMAAERTSSVSTNISTARCCSAWNVPIFFPNCSRVFR